jgi:hypothetical protein
MFTSDVRTFDEGTDGSPEPLFSKARSQTTVQSTLS